MLPPSHLHGELLLDKCPARVALQHVQVAQGLLPDGAAGGNARLHHGVQELGFRLQREEEQGAALQVQEKEWADMQALAAVPGVTAASGSNRIKYGRFSRIVWIYNLSHLTARHRAPPVTSPSS